MTSLSEVSSLGIKQKLITFRNWECCGWWESPEDSSTEGKRRQLCGMCGWPSCFSFEICMPLPLKNIWEQRWCNGYLLACGARGLRFYSRSRRYDFRDWLSPASKSRWNTAKVTYILKTTSQPKEHLVFIITITPRNSSSVTISFMLLPHLFFSSAGRKSGEICHTFGVRVPVRLHKNFNIAYNSWTAIGKAFIFHLCIPCDKTFPWMT